MTGALWIGLVVASVAAVALLGGAVIFGRGGAGRADVGKPLFFTRCDPPGGESPHLRPNKKRIEKSTPRGRNYVRN